MKIEIGKTFILGKKKPTVLRQRRWLRVILEGEKHIIQVRYAFRLAYYGF